MTPDASPLWLEKSHRLEQDRRLLLNLWQALDRAEMAMNGSGGGIVDAPEFRVLFQRVEQALSALDLQQRDYLAHFAGDDLSGRKGASVGDLAFVRWMDSTAARALAGREVPVIAQGILADVEAVASAQGVSVRTWIEGALRRQLHSGGAIREETRMVLAHRCRERLREGPVNCVDLARELGEPVRRVSRALKNLRARGLARYNGPHGSRHHPWISTEER